MKILVTGAAGFIGFNLCLKLLKKYKNIKIIGIDNINNYYSVKLKKKRLNELKKFKNFKFIKLDLQNIKILSKLFQYNKFNTVFHLAAQAGVVYSIKNPRNYLNANINGFFNILDCGRKFKVKKIYYASSSSVYGNSVNFPLDEQQQTKPINFYGFTKKSNEEIAEIFSTFYNMKLIGLRFFTVYGEWGRPDMVIFKIIDSLFRKKTFYLNNSGNHFRDFTYIGDVVEMIDLLRFKKFERSHEIFNICSNKPIKLTKVVKIFQSKGFNLKFKNRSFQKADILKTHGNNKKILKIINFKKFTQFKIGIQKTISWYKNFYSLNNLNK